MIRQNTNARLDAALKTCLRDFLELTKHEYIAAREVDRFIHAVHAIRNDDEDAAASYWDDTHDWTLHMIRVATETAGDPTTQLRYVHGVSRLRRIVHEFHEASWQIREGKYLDEETGEMMTAGQLIEALLAPRQANP